MIKVWLWPRLTFQWAAPSKWYSRWVLLDRLILAVRHGDTGDMWKALESIKCDQWWHASTTVLFTLSGVGYVVATSRCSVWQYPLHSWLGISFLRRCRNSGFAEWLLRRLCGVCRMVLQPPAAQTLHENFNECHYSASSHNISQYLTCTH